MMEVKLYIIALVVVEVKEERLLNVLILCGGFGTRLQSVIDDRPKVLAPIHGIPFLTYQLALLKKQGFKEIVLCTGYMHDMIESHYGGGSNYGLSITYSKEEKPLGTGGAILKAVNNFEGDMFLVLNGDTYADIDYNELIENHRRISTTVSIALISVGNSSRYGKVVIDGNGYVTSFKEKEAKEESGLINAGAYVVGKSIVDMDKFGSQIGRRCSFEREILPALVQQELVMGFAFNPFVFVDIGTPADYEKAKSILNTDMLG